MIRTRVGYAGGTTSDPTYYNIGDYSETVQVDFDPSRVSYDKLVDAFWSGHDPTYPPYSRQYRSAILYNSEEQRQTAIKSKEREESRLGKVLFTDIEADTGFYVAEDYHQKYYLRETPELMAEISAIYPDPQDFMNSTAAARLNGYVAGYGNQDTLKKQLNSLGLSESGQQRLLQITASGLIPGCPVNPSG